MCACACVSVSLSLCLSVSLCLPLSLSLALSLSLSRARARALYLSLSLSLTLFSPSLSPPPPFCMYVVYRYRDLLDAGPLREQAPLGGARQQVVQEGGVEQHLHVYRSARVTPQALNDGARSYGASRGPPPLPPSQRWFP